MEVMMCSFLIVLLEKTHHNRANNDRVGWNSCLKFFGERKSGHTVGTVASFKNEILIFNVFFSLLIYKDLCTVSTFLTVQCSVSHFLSAFCEHFLQWILSHFLQCILCTFRTVHFEQISYRLCEYISCCWLWGHFLQYTDL